MRPQNEWGMNERGLQEGIEWVTTLIYYSEEATKIKMAIIRQIEW